MKFSTLTNLNKFQLPAKVLLSILAVSLCFGASDRASAITDSPIPGSLTPSNAPINPGSTFPGSVIAPVTPPSTCANVEVKLDNRTSDTVKITKFEYYDTTQNIYIEKNLFGASGVEQVQSGKKHEAKRNFDLIDNRQTHFRVTYKHKQGPNNFAAAVEELSNPFACIDGSTHTVRLNN
jgi:hypothetical protein